MKVCVVIPAYNEAEHVGGLIRALRGRGLDVLLVDDGSSDGTAARARDAGATVMSNATNRGKGFSLAAGFAAVLRDGYDAVITVDGDGQHHPEDIDVFIRQAERDCGIIVGNRLHNPRSMPLVRVFTNRLMSWVISLVVGQRIPDTQCGFRLIKRQVLEGLRLTTSKYEIESEILIEGARRGFRIASVPVRSIYQDERSYIHPVSDTLRFLRYLAGALIRRSGGRGT